MKKKAEKSKHEVITYRDPEYQLSQLAINFPHPSVFNGVVSFRRWRVTAEVIEEPIETYRERLLRLWRESDNHHDCVPLQNAAKKIGYELPIDEHGSDRAGRYERSKTVKE